MTRHLKETREKPSESQEISDSAPLGNLKEPMYRVYYRLPAKPSNI